jgi:mannan endo-1,4-beta-mannosidase
MKRNLFVAVSCIIIVVFVLFCVNKMYKSSYTELGYCYIGAFLSDNPTREDIISFGRDYGKKPYLVLVFIDWENFVDKNVLDNIFSQGSCPVITWEPFYWNDKSGVDFQDILDGKFDDYIENFANLLGSFKKPVYLRFAHEMNGDWYPWSGSAVGAENYKAVYRYIKDKFDGLGVDSIKWVFSINWENVPKANNYRQAYPGDNYVDYIGIDGYNWGVSQSWSKWMSFEDIFGPVYKEICEIYDKEIIITEFSSTSKGGDKAKWIKDAFLKIKQMKKVRGFILFNVDKETDWSFPPESVYGNALKAKLEDEYFLGGQRIREGK